MNQSPLDCQDLSDKVDGLCDEINLLNIQINILHTKIKAMIFAGSLIGGAVVAELFSLLYA